MKKYTMYLEGKNQYCEMSILLKWIYRFIAIPIKLPRAFFTELDQNFTIYMETQKNWAAKAILRKKNVAGGIRFSDFRLSHKVHKDGANTEI